MKHKIIICGGNGAGKSTLGKALADKTGWDFRDIEDYYFPKTDPDYPYAVQRTGEEVVSLLYEDLKKNDNLIFASVRGNHSEKTAAMFTCAVFVSVPKEIRMKRVRQRAFDKFGDRVSEGGDLYEREKAFYDIIEKRTDKTITDWLETMDIPVIRVDGTKPVEENVEVILSKLNEVITMSKTTAFNPYLPSWEYIPDGEPYVFGDRVYVYGSHDFYNGYVFCMGDYVCWSAPIDDLGNWRYEGVIYERCADPMNKQGKMCLYAPDVTIGPDGRYYLYYVLDKTSVMSVAVCDTPAGKYEFYGYVHYPDGTRLGERDGDEPQFDPGVITEGENTYLYSGFCGKGDKSRTGALVVVLDKDMLTVKTEAITVVPGCEYSAGTGFEGHAFFEASSIRKVDGKYVFIYSSEVMHELCYAVSDSPLGRFVYGGVLISNTDLHVDSYKPADMPMAYGANNHGSIVEINGSWYIFYHRHTNGTWYSRQGCAEKLVRNADGSFAQAEMTSCGLNDAPLEGKGEYPAYLACNLFTEKHSLYVGEEGAPRVMQDGKDGDKETGYIGNITNGATAGFKYFECKGVSRFSVTSRGYAKGVYEVRTKWDGDILAQIPVEFSNVWETYSTQVNIPDGINAIYLTYRGEGTGMLKSFTLE